MFDVLVDHPKKRLYVCLMLIGFVLEISLLFDLIFGFDVLRAPTFTELLNLQNQNDQSFYSYFFFSCLSSGVAYLKLSFSTILSYIHLVLQALSSWDWVLVSALVFLLISHKTKQSKIALCILVAYFVCRFLVLVGISASLIQAMQTNSANGVLSRIQISSIVLIFVHAFALVGNSYWLLTLIRDHYLKLFKENDSR